MKPGQSPNIANPMLSDSAALANMNMVGRGSSQTPETAQLSMNANRNVPPRRPAGPSGTAEIEVNDVAANQTSDYTASTKSNFATRKRIFNA